MSMQIRIARQLQQDISERTLGEQALRESHERFNQLADNITDAFWIRSPDMREVQYISPAFERIWGRSPESLLANPQQWVDFTVPEDRERVVRAFATLMAEARSVDLEYRIARPDGEIRWVRVRGFQVRDAADKLISLTGIVTDITDKKALESQFLRAQRMESIGTLAGGIAHDLNNVLAPILMSIQTLKDLVVDEQGIALLETLEASAQRGADLVNQVLVFARGVEGQRITVNPLRVMGDLVRIMRETFPKSIDVRAVPARDLWTVTGDPTQMHQVLLNLCVNARDAMPAGGHLIVRMDNVVLDETCAGMSPDSRPGAYVMVTVADTGSGIPPEMRDKIFEPFFTTKEMGKGTGLGLSTTLAIVRSHGGFIHLDTVVGKGTAFRVYLPANTLEPATAEVAAERPQLPRGNGELILVVDDEEAIRLIAQRTLERFGYRVLLARDGAEALALYVRRREEIAVVLTDMAMPGMDGPALITEIKKINPGSHIIGSSGLASTAVLKALGTRVEHFVRKPYTAGVLLTALHQVLSPDLRVPSVSSS